MEFLESILTELALLPTRQWLALLTGLAYVILAAREHLSCWLFGVFSCALIAYDDFFSFQLYSDGILQIFYVIMGFIGLYQWRFGGQRNSALKISEISWQQHILILLAGTLLSFPVGYLFNHYTDAAFAYVDSLTTVFSVFATVLLIRKIRSNWLYWIVIDLVYVFLFSQRSGLLIAVLFAIYAVVAIHGFSVWGRRVRVDPENLRK